MRGVVRRARWSLVLLCIASSARAAQVATGSYVGDGTDNRPIATVGFAPDAVFVTDEMGGSDNRETVLRTAAMVGDLSCELTTKCDVNRIQALRADGFEIGSDVAVNKVGRVYHYVALKSDACSPDVAVGSYTGDGADNRTIGAAGFAPSYVLLKRGDTATTAMQRFAPEVGDASLPVNASSAEVANRIQALRPTGFEIGSHAAVNAAGDIYYWVASRAGNVGSYLGSGADARAVGGVGFAPSWVLVRGSGSRQSVHRPASIAAATDSSLFLAGVNAATDRIEALGNDGFTVGTNDQVNHAGVTYFFTALRSAPSTCPTATATVTATGTATRTATSSATPTRTATATATASNTPTPPNTATSTATPTGTATRTATPVDTATSTSTATATPTWTPTPVDTATPTAVYTATATATDTATVTATPPPIDTDTPTPADTDTPTPVDTPTVTATPTDSATPEDTATATPTATCTESDTATATPTDSATPEDTATATPTATETTTATYTETSTATATDTDTPTATPTAVDTATATPTNTATATQTRTFTVTQTPTRTPTWTPTQTPTPALQLIAVYRDGVGGIDGLSGATAVVVSPNGSRVYAASAVDAAVALFNRDVSGALTYVARYTAGTANFAGDNGISVSPDGTYVYVSVLVDSRIKVYRDFAGFGLSFVEDQVDGGAILLNSPLDVTVSPDGAHVYASAWGDQAVSVFARNAANGHLTFTSSNSVGFPNRLVISSDNAHAYVTAEGSNELRAYARNTTTGALTFLQSLRDGVGGVDGLAAAEGLAISPDGQHVYATGPDDAAVAVFARNAGTGLLTFVEVKRVSGSGLAGTAFVSVSPDGARVYATARTDDALVVFARNASTGRLTWLATYRDGVAGVDGLDDAHDIGLSPDGTCLYVASKSDNAVAFFRVNP